MTRPAFGIPRNRRYWRDRTPTATELSRLLASAQRCYPDVAFEICEHPPRSQRYPRDSDNAQIRRTLESMSALDLAAQSDPHLPPGWHAAGTEMESERPPRPWIRAESLSSSRPLSQRSVESGRLEPDQP